MHYLLYGRSVAHTEVWAPVTLFEGLLSLAEETYRRLKLSQEKTSRELVGNKIFVKKTFAYCSLVPPKDTRKLSYKTSKSRNRYPLKVSRCMV